jgi:hypothetical protein
MIRPTPRYATRGQPSHAAPPAQVVHHIQGALASSVASREALITQHSCFVLATNELDDSALSPRELPEGYKGQAHIEWGFRFLKDPLFLASSLYLKKPQPEVAELVACLASDRAASITGSESVIDGSTISTI